MEQWREIKGEHGYRVSSTGKVETSHIKGTLRRGEWKPIGSRKNVRGYECVCLRIDGKKRSKVVHRLVAEAFIDNPENKPFVNHIDGNKTNNNLENLEWCTASENFIHALNTGLVKPRPIKLKAEDIPHIRKLLEAKVPTRKIGPLFNVHHSVIDGIKAGRYWKNN